MKLEEARTIANGIVRQLQALDGLGPSRVMVCGSIRRGRPDVGDIDIVAEVNEAQREAVLEVFEMRPGVFVKASGPELLRLELRGGIGVDLYFAHPRQKDRPSNWGSVVLCRTGSKEHNVMLAGLAKSLGRHWKIQEGVFKGDQFIAGATEEKIFEALGMAWVKPEDRK